MANLAIDTARLRAFLEDLEYRTDVRKFPDNRRRGQFRRQWNAAAVAGPNSPMVLRQLTWSNLGRRAGLAFGPADEGTINATFDLLARIYVEDRNR